MWLISSECQELTEAIPLAICDEETDGDIVKVTSISDDYLDMGRYGLKSMLQPGSKPFAVKRDEALIEIERKVVGVGPATHEQAVRIHNAQFMTDLKMQTARAKRALPRWSRQR